MENSNYNLSKTKSASLTFLVMMFIYLVLILLIPSVIATFLQKDSIVYSAITSFISPISIVLSLLLIKFLGGEKPNKLLKNLKFSPVFGITSVLLSASLLLGFGFINIYISLALNLTGKGIVLTGLGSYIIYVITTGIVPAVFEEIFFRGYILENLREAGDIFAIIFSGLFFALFHLSLSQFVFQFICGIVFAIIKIKSKSIIPSIIAHFSNNFIILTLLYFKVNENFLLSPLYVSIGIVVCISLLLFICLLKGKKSENVKNKLQKSKVKEFFIPFGIIGALICLTMIIGGLFA